jgi:hypothetical protein
MDVGSRPFHAFREKDRRYCFPYIAGVIAIRTSPIDQDRGATRGPAVAVSANYLGDAESARDESLFGGRLGGALAFLLPAAQFVQFDLVGSLYASDLLAFGVLMLAVVSDARVLGRRLPRTFLVLGFLWLLAQVITDLVRATPFHDYTRGWAMIAFTLINFAALYLLLNGNRRRIILCALGFAAGNLLTYFCRPDFYAVTYPWKFGYGYAVSLLVVLIAVFFISRGRGMLAVAVMMAVAGLNLYHDYRSLAGECFVAAAYLMLSRPVRRREQGAARASPGQAIVACAVLVLSIVGLLRIYAYCAGNGFLGYGAWQKYEMQSSGRYGVLIGGRGDFLTGLEAAAASPIVGHGSWAKDWRYASRENAMLAGLGYETSGGVGSWLIPAHSYLVGAWVHAGILGAVFWLWVLSLPVRMLMRLYTRDEPIAPLFVFLSTGLIWDVLFSPFGATARLSASFAVVTLICCLEADAGLGEPVTRREAQCDETLDRYNFI